MISEIAAIALPSLGGMLLDPLMSLIDTACVGQVSTKSLAAMAPHQYFNLPSLHSSFYQRLLLT